ncbi:hypothetical protein BDV93DRAFT_567047 [Ceratobasidium sp. AG-I]|nr:hypothetical protein BDV93DRAFT_567047 [Ceratobasidium sp. AG-I]
MPADLATIEEMLDLCLALNVALESTSFSADVKMDQLSSALAGSAYDTTTGALEDATMTVNFATTAEPMSGATKDVQMDQLFEASQQDPSAATHAYNHPASYSSGPPLQTEATPMDSDMSMTDEQCLAQLSELCHGMTIPDSLDPSFDLSTVLDSLLSELSALSPASPSNSLESQSETQSTLIGLATLGSNSGRLRIQDWVDPSFIFDSAAMDESEADLDSPATPDSVPMDVDKSLKTEGYWSTGVCEQETVCPLDTLLANSQICRPISRF